MTISTAAAERRPSLAPMLLTVFRIVAGPAIAALLLYADGRVFIDGAGAVSALVAWAFALFVVAALTDALDGMLARRLNAVTPLGAALDHAADKVLLACVLVAVAATSAPVDVIFAAVILIGRDFLIGGLREGAANTGRPIPVAPMGKLKTALAFVGAGSALAAQWAALAMPATPVASMLGGVAQTTLWGAAIVAVASAAIYLRAAAKP